MKNYTVEELGKLWKIHVASTTINTEDKLPMEEYEILHILDDLWRYRFIRHTGKDACPICNQAREHDTFDDHCDKATQYVTETPEGIQNLLNQLSVEGSWVITEYEPMIDVKGIDTVSIPCRVESGSGIYRYMSKITAKYLRDSSESRTWTRSYFCSPKSDAFCPYCGKFKSHASDCGRQYKKVDTSEVIAAIEAYYETLDTGESCERSAELIID